MKARLFARFGPDAGLEVEFGAEATIGRGKENGVLLGSREVSQHHARVFFDAESGAYWVEDLGSLNGTQLDGEPLTGRRRLGALHVLSFGGASELFFVELDREPGEPPKAAAPAEKSGTRVEDESPKLPPGLERLPAGEGTQVDQEMPTLPAGLQNGGAKAGSATRVDEAPVELPPALADGGESEAARFVLQMEAGDRFVLQPGENLVGRSRRARVVLSSRELSRRHATLRVEGNRVWLRDEESRNHTFVGGEQIAGEVEIQPGSELRFGRLEGRLTVVGDGESEER